MNHAQVIKELLIGSVIKSQYDSCSVTLINGLLHRSTPFSEDYLSDFRIVSRPLYYLIHDYSNTEVLKRGKREELLEFNIQPMTHFVTNLMNLLDGKAIKFANRTVRITNGFIEYSGSGSSLNSDLVNYTFNVIKRRK